MFSTHKSKRSLRLEALEPRLVLSGTPPTVADFNVSSTQWSADFVQYLEDNSLGTDGYSVPVGANQQLIPLTWNNIDQIRITFSEDVAVQAWDLSVSGVNTTAYEFSDFAYDASTYTAVWTLSAALEKDKVLVDLSGDGLDPVQDGSGNVLDGEWTTNVSTYASGDGTAGGDFEFRIDVLPGEVSGGTMVTGYDYILTRILQGKTTADPGYLHIRDIDGSGTIDTTDWMYVYSQIFSQLPTGDPVGISNDAPTTAGFADVNLLEDTLYETVSLWDKFADAEDNSADLTYEIIGNSNAGLFDSLYVDDITDELLMNFDIDVFGEADLVIRATDSSGLHVDTTLHVNVDPVNDGPLIINFVGIGAPDDTWTFTGTVTDVDDDPAGQHVTIVFLDDEYTTTVDPDGTFFFGVELDPDPFGTALAWTFDQHGLQSNTAGFFIG